MKMKVKIPRFTGTSLMVALLGVIYIFSNTYVVRNSQLTQNIFDMIEAIVLLVLIVKILVSNYRTRTFAVVCITIFCLLLCYLHTRQAELIEAAIVILALKNAPTNKTYHLLYYVFVLSLIIVLIMYVTGFSDSGVMRRGDVGLGFASPNVGSRIIQTTVFLWALSKPKIKSTYINAVYFVIAILTFITTGSRLTVFLLICYPFMISIIKKLMSQKRGNTIANVFCLVPPILFFLSIVLTYLYESHTWVQILNVILSNRVYMNYIAIQEYGYSLLGYEANISMFVGSFDLVVNKYINFLTIDSQYIYLLVYYGWVGVVIGITVIMIVIKKAWNNGNATIVATTVLLCVYSLTETIGSIFGFPSLIYLLMEEDVPDNFEINSGKKGS